MHPHRLLERPPQHDPINTKHPNHRLGCFLRENAGVGVPDDPSNFRLTADGMSGTPSPTILFDMEGQHHVHR